MENVSISAAFVIGMISLVLICAPMLLAGISGRMNLSAADPVFVYVVRIRRYIKGGEVTGRVLLMTEGNLFMSNNLTVLSGYFAEWFPFHNQLS